MRKLLLLLSLQAIGLSGMFPMPASGQACPYIRGTQYPYWWTDALALASGGDGLRGLACVRSIPTTKDVAITFPGGRVFGRWRGKGAVEARAARVACLPKEFVGGSNGVCGQCVPLALWVGQKNPPALIALDQLCELRY